MTTSRMYGPVAHSMFCMCDHESRSVTAHTGYSRFITKPVRSKPPIVSVVLRIILNPYINRNVTDRRA